MRSKSTLATEPAYRALPRYRWLRRISVGLLTAAILLAAARGWWGYVADRRLAKLIDEAHARGESILPEEFRSASVVDSRNAALLYLKAGTAITPVTGFEDLQLDSEPLTAADYSLIERMT